MFRMLLATVCVATLLSTAGCLHRDSGPTAAGASDAVALGMANVISDEVVSFEQCPEAVQATIEAHRQGGTIVGIERTTDHGEVLYEVDVRGEDGVVEFDVAENGAFRGYENESHHDDDGDDDDGDDDEEQIPLSEVPHVVQQAALAAVPGLVLEEAVREREGERTVYELEGEADGVEYEIEVTASGEVLEIDVDDDEDDDDDED